MLQVFKTMNEEHFGELSFFRIYSGHVTTGMVQRHAVSPNASGRFFCSTVRSAPGSRLSAGDIGATVKLKNTHTGDTLCAPNHPVKLSVPEYPLPNLHAALQPRSRGEEDKIAAGLATLHDEDPAFEFGGSRTSPDHRCCAGRTASRRRRGTASPTLQCSLRSH